MAAIMPFEEVHSAANNPNESHPPLLLLTTLSTQLATSSTASGGISFANQFRRDPCKPDIKLKAFSRKIRNGG
jgi:hypothetical protein